jgi:hypothetical protein
MEFNDVVTQLGALPLAFMNVNTLLAMFKYSDFWILPLLTVSVELIVGLFTVFRITDVFNVLLMFKRFAVINCRNSGIVTSELEIVT